MSNNLQLFGKDSDPLGALPTGEESAQESRQTKVDVLGLLRRRWLLIALLWLIPTVPVVALILTKWKPTYTATGIVEVRPIEDKILYRDDNSDSRFFQADLRTQSNTILNQSVLQAALSQLRVDSPELDILQKEDPLPNLRLACEAELVPNSFLITLSVTQDKGAEAVKIADAILQAYMEREGDQGATTRARRKAVLESERDELYDKLEELNQYIYDLANVYGAATEELFGVLRESHEQDTMERRSALRAAEDELFEIEQKLGVLNSSTSQPAAVWSEDVFAERSRFIESDPMVISVRQQITDVSSKLADYLSRLPEESQTVTRTREKLERLRQQHERFRNDAMEAFDAQLVQQQAQRHVEMKATLEHRLKSAQLQRDRLRMEVQGLEEKGLQIGKQGIEIEQKKASRDQIERLYDQIQNELRKLDIESRRLSRIRVASNPEIRPSGINDPRKKYSAMSVAGFFGFAFIVGLLLELRDQRLRETDQLKQFGNLPLLGAVPSIHDLEKKIINEEDFAESYRLIRTALNGCSRGRNDKVYLITSARSGEGKTSLAVSLAISLTEPGHRVLLIDGDTQCPNAGRILKIKPTVGLRDALEGKRSPRECIMSSGVTGLEVMVCRSNGQSLSGLLDTRTAKRILDDLRETYDYIILDSPPTLSTADALVWASAVDGVILSSFIGHTDRVAMQMARERLESVGGQILGVVTSNVPHNSRFYSYSTTSTEREQGHERDVGPHPLLMAHRLDDKPSKKKS